MKIHAQVLFIDQDTTVLKKITTTLQQTFSNTFELANDKKQVAEVLHATRSDIVFIDLGFNGTGSGLQIFEKLSKSSAKLVIPVIPENDEQLTAKIIESDPFFYITKPYDLAEVQLALKRANEKLKHWKSRDNDSHDNGNFHGIIGTSQQMTALFDLITRVADDDYSTVLIRGESGTGKELVAKAIHARSRRREKNFVPVNCAAIPDDLLESELFGHTKGAFTGANQNKQGRIQYADGGTLFLDEIGDMKPNLQAKLLRVLQEKEFEPVGGLQPTPVDTRILAATHCDLEKLVSEGQFREDLYYRLSVIPLHIPPLKSRREDIPHLIDFFIATYTSDRGREPFEFTTAAMENLLRYNWKGNVRELENLIQHMSILYSGKTVDLADLPEKYLMQENLSDEDVSLFQKNSSSRSSIPPQQEEATSLFSLESLELHDKEIDLKEMINRFETELIIKALRATGGNKKEAARILKLKRTTLLEKIKKKKLSSDNW